MRVLYRIGFWFCMGLALLIITYLCLYAIGLRVNDTHSVAKGLYRIIDHTPQRGSYITFCPPDTPAFQMARTRGYIGFGFCPNQYSGLMKFVAGIPGDKYEFSDDGIWINDQLLPNTRPLYQDSFGQPLPVFRGKGQLKDDEYIFVGTAVANSFDARYYGLIKGSHIQHIVKPLWVEN